MPDVAIKDPLTGKAFYDFTKAMKTEDILRDLLERHLIFFADEAALEDATLRIRDLYDE